MAAAASERSLAAATAGDAQAMLAASGTTTPQIILGPCLFEGMGESSLITTLNAWGAARDRELIELKTDLGATQVGVSSAFDQAKDTLLNIVVSSRAEAETARQQGHYEAAQSVARRRAGGP